MTFTARFASRLGLLCLASFVGMSPLLQADPTAFCHASDSQAALQLKSAMVRAGLDPDALAAAGVAPGSVSTVVAGARGAVVSSATALSQADTTYATTHKEASWLAALLERGLGSPQLASDLQDARVAEANASAQRATILDQIFAAATTSLPQAQRDALSLLRGNRTWGVALEFCVISRSASEWCSLRDALANERIAAQNGESADPGAQVMLANWRAAPAVAASRAALDTNLPQIRTNWNAAAGTD